MICNEANTIFRLVAATLDTEPIFPSLFMPQPDRVHFVLTEPGRNRALLQFALLSAAESMELSKMVLSGSQRGFDKRVKEILTHTSWTRKRPYIQDIHFMQTPQRMNRVPLNPYQEVPPDEWQRVSTMRHYFAWLEAKQERETETAFATTVPNEVDDQDYEPPMLS